MDISKFERFTPKEDLRIKFDPNVRHRLPEMPNHLQYGFMYGHSPETEAQSQYCAVNFEGVTYHLFNAKRMPLGRIACNIATYARGKHRPGYDPKKYGVGDKCVIVNYADPYMTGTKRNYKLYRHHTGYPGGLKEYSYKTILEKNPHRILNDAVLGMLPKNGLRHDVLKNIIIYDGPYHDLQRTGLPQFTEPKPFNINDELGHKEINKENSILTYYSSAEVPEEYKDFDMELDTSFADPFGAKVKTHT